MATAKTATQTNWAALSTARRIARGHDIKSPTAWAQFVRVQTDSKKPLPAKPDEAYADKWVGWADFLGVDVRVGRPEKYWPYAKAAKHIQALGLKTKNEFVAYARSAICPLEIPVAPNHVYKAAGWVGYAEFLGTPLRGIAASRQYWPYEQARDFVHAQKFATTAAWGSWSRSAKKPAEIPATPHLTYRGEGWSNWADFLGAEYQRRARMDGLRRPLKLLSFTKARAVVSALGFKTAQDFRLWAKSGARPENIPIHPDLSYKGETWKGWGHFLGADKALRGVGRHSTREVMSYPAASALAQTLNLTSAADYLALIKLGTLPTGLPAQPPKHYQEAGWTSWGDFLGSRSKDRDTASALKVRDDGSLKFTEARKLVRSLNLSNSAAWFRFASSSRRPVYVPKEPWKTYFQEGYTSLEDFIGATPETLVTG